MSGTLEVAIVAIAFALGAVLGGIASYIWALHNIVSYVAALSQPALERFAARVARIRAARAMEEK